MKRDNKFIANIKRKWIKRKKCQNKTTTKMKKMVIFMGKRKYMIFLIIFSILNIE